jgi:hypothetical protein
LLVGVQGITPGQTSQFRLTAYSEKNKIVPNTPVAGTLSKAGDYDYYWFLGNASVGNP